MAEILMPQMGESIAEGTLTRWFKKLGESVKRDEPLFEISTDKVNAEIPSPSDGVLQEILVQEGSTVEVNTVVAVLGDGNGTVEAAPAAEKAPAKAEPPGQDAPPQDDPQDTQPRDAPTRDAPTQDAPTQASTPPSPSATERAPAPPVSASSDGASIKKTRSSPLVRRIARENGVADLSAVPGTGVGGRVTKIDILDFVDRMKSGGTRAPAPGPAPASVAHADTVFPVLNLPRENTRVEPMSLMRKKIAEHMIHSRRTSAHVHSVFEIDVDRIAKLRARKKNSFLERYGVKLTYMPFFMKATVDTLLKFPWVNASIDGEEIVLHNSVNLGIAVALDWGLIVPVIKGADELNMVGLQRKVTDLGARARSKKLLPDEVQGGTFTITNPGAFGNEFGIPIISQPQVAILGIGGVKKRAVVVEGDAIAVRHTCFMCLSYDHRLVDGALADHFMATLKENLENWDDSTLE